MKKYINFIIISVIFLFGFTLILGEIGETDYQSNFCKVEGSMLTNLSNADYWMVEHDEPFNDACCSEAGYGSYERDSGTIGRFLFGANARYAKSNCEWLTDEQQVRYSNPNWFKKQYLGIKYSVGFAKGEK